MRAIRLVYVTIISIAPFFNLNSMNFFTQKKAEDVVANVYIKFNEKTITALTTIKNNLIDMMAKQNTKNPQQFRQTYKNKIAAAQQDLPADINNKLNNQLTTFYAHLENTETHTMAVEEYENLLLTIQNRITKLQKNYEDYINQKMAQRSFMQRLNPLSWSLRDRIKFGIGTVVFMGILYSDLVTAILRVPSIITRGINVVNEYVELLENPEKKS